MQNKTLDTVLLIIQIVTFSLAVILESALHYETDNRFIISIVLLFLSAVAKLLRQLPRTDAKTFLKTQRASAIAYFITAFLIIFEYYLYRNLMEETYVIVLNSINYFLEIFCFSLLSIPEYQRLSEFRVYFVLAAFIGFYAAYTTIDFIQYFNNLAPNEVTKYTNLAKDYLLLIMPTYISLILVVLDLLLKARDERKELERKQQSKGTPTRKSKDNIFSSEDLEMPK